MSNSTLRSFELDHREQTAEVMPPMLLRANNMLDCLDRLEARMEELERNSRQLRRDMEELKRGVATLGRETEWLRRDSYDARARSDWSRDSLRFSEDTWDRGASIVEIEDDKEEAAIVSPPIASNNDDLALVIHDRKRDRDIMQNETDDGHREYREGQTRDEGPKRSKLTGSRPVFNGVLREDQLLDFEATLNAHTEPTENPKNLSPSEGQADPHQSCLDRQDVTRKGL